MGSENEDRITESRPSILFTPPPEGAAWHSDSFDPFPGDTTLDWQSKNLGVWDRLRPTSTPVRSYWDNFFGRKIYTVEGKNNHCSRGKILCLIFGMDLFLALRQNISGKNAAKNPKKNIREYLTAANQSVSHKPEQRYRLPKGGAAKECDHSRGFNRSQTTLNGTALTNRLILQLYQSLKLTQTKATHFNQNFTTEYSPPTPTQTRSSDYLHNKSESVVTGYCLLFAIRTAIHNQRSRMAPVPFHLPMVPFRAPLGTASDTARHPTQWG